MLPKEIYSTSLSSRIIYLISLQELLSHLRARDDSKHLSLSPVLLTRLGFVILLGMEGFSSLVVDNGKDLCVQHRQTVLYYSLLLLFPSGFPGLHRFVVTTFRDSLRGLSVSAVQLKIKMVFDMKLFLCKQIGHCSFNQIIFH